MEMEVMIPAPAPAFNFNISAPSTPQRYYSAPTSPARASAFYGGADWADSLSSSPSAIPFLWEEKPGLPKPHLTPTATSSNYDQELDADFAFDFSGHLDANASLPADELFHGGVIKPLKPPPRFHYDQNRPLESPKSPGRFAQAFSPSRHRSAKDSDFDPFAAAMDQTRNADRRGRERNTRERNKKSSRSLSPFRASDLLFDPDTNQEDRNQTKNTTTTPSFSSPSLWYKKWKIKDLLLFRSASESRAKDKGEQLNKYTQLKKNRDADVKNSSFRSTESVGSVSSRRRSGPPISAHEMHYTVNRAFSEEMRKRTTLPYKQGLLGCLGFSRTVSRG